MDKKSKGFFFRSFAGHQSCRPSGFKLGLTCCHAPPELKAALGVPVLLSCWSAWNQTAVCVSDQCVLFAASRCASAPPWQWQLTRQVYTQAFPEDLDKLCCKSREGGHLLQTPPRGLRPLELSAGSHTLRDKLLRTHTLEHKKIRTQSADMKLQTLSHREDKWKQFGVRTLLHRLTWNIHHRTFNLRLRATFSLLLFLWTDSKTLAHLRGRVSQMLDWRRYGAWWGANRSHARVSLCMCLCVFL